MFMISNLTHNERKQKVTNQCFEKQKKREKKNNKVTRVSSSVQAVNSLNSCRKRWPWLIYGDNNVKCHF